MTLTAARDFTGRQRVRQAIRDTAAPAFIRCGLTDTAYIRGRAAMSCPATRGALLYLAAEIDRQGGGQ